MYENVMVAIDNSECSNWAIDAAVELARTTGARLTGNHVYAASLHDSRFRQLEPGLPERFRSTMQRLRDAHQDLIGQGMRIISGSYLDVFDARCSAAGIAGEKKIQEGRHYDQLAKDARESGYDLVVLGAHGLGRVDRSVLGSVCERVVRLVDCDTLIVRNDRPLGDGPLVVAIDGSGESFRALDVALALARSWDRSVSAVAAYDPYYHAVAFKSIANVLPDGSFRFKEQEDLHDEIIDGGLMKVYRSHLERAQQLAAERDVDLDISVLTGKSFDAIVSYAESVGPSLLLAGRVGIHQCDGLSLGSTAENLMRVAPCNLLLVSA